MRILSKPAIISFAAVHENALEPLMHWYRVAKRAQWCSLSEVRVDFRHADVVGDFTVFNIAGNKYRLITLIRYSVGVVYIREILTHSEYDKGRWNR